MSTTPFKQWRLAQVNATKKTVRTELSEIELAHGVDARLRQALSSISELMNCLDSGSQLRCFITVVSVLYHHARHGGLPQTQVNRLGKLGLSILKLQRIKPQHSKLSFLYGELNLALSQISRADGNQWLSAWQLALSQYLSGGEGPLSQGAYELAQATRLSRLGHLDMALAALGRALLHGLEGRELETAKLRQIRTLRLAGNKEMARSLVQQALAEPSWSQQATNDLTWELACLDVSESGDYSAMGKLILRGKTHYKAAYLIEGWFWAACMPSLDGLNRVTKMTSLARNRRLDPKQQGTFFEIALHLQKFTDTDIPYGFRLIDIGRQLEQLDQTLTVDKSLLIWGAMARMLSRNGSFEFATLALVRYRDLCRQLSNAQTDDLLGVLGDLYERDWFNQKTFDPSILETKQVG